MTTARAHRVVELDVPATMDDDRETVRAFRDWLAVSDRAEEDVHGLPELAWTPEEYLPMCHEAEGPSRLFAVLDHDGTMVAAGAYDSKAAPGTTNCWLSTGVLPEHRRQGVGTLLADHLEGLARAEGRTQWKTYAVSRQVGTAFGPGYLEAPTGHGAVPVDEAAVRFLSGRGWRFGQVNRISRLELPAAAEALDRARATATAAAGYRVHTWTGRTPERWEEGIALMQTRMSTDAPEGDMAEPEDVWTVERLRENERQLATSPRTALTVFVEHVATGAPAGFSQLAIPPEPERAVQQWNTLVLREHRGHRLGMVLKVAGIDTVERDHPGHPSIVTFNAEENRPMLAVNEAVGFVGVGSEGIWEHRV